MSDEKDANEEPPQPEQPVAGMENVSSLLQSAEEVGYTSVTSTL